MKVLMSLAICVSLIIGLSSCGYIQGDEVDMEPDYPKGPGLFTGKKGYWELLSPR